MFSKLKPRQKRLILWGLTCLSLFGVSLLAVGPNGAMNSYERLVFDAIYGLPDWTAPFFRTITFLGSIWLVMGLVIGLAIAKRLAVAARLGLAVGVASLATVAIKEFIMRPRPFYLLEFVENRDLPTVGFGFPSSHAAIAFAAALLLMHFAPKSYRIWLVGAAALVAVSRIYLGVHVPLDVVAGAAIGGLSVVIVQLIPRIPHKF